MSDSDNTILSTSSSEIKGSGETPPSSDPSPTGQPPQRNPLVIAGGIGCLLLLCVGLVVGGGYYLARDQLNELMAGGGTMVEIDEPTVEPTEETVPDTGDETATVEADTDTGADAANEDDATATAEAVTAEAATGEAAAVPLEPEFSDITFAMGATDEYDPIDPGTTFAEGLTEIHAIFDYDGMASDATWTRIWYLDGEEVLNNTAAWTGDQSGRFDYFIDAGGDPLSPGEWELELFVDDQLLASGSFVIEAEEAPEIAQVDENAEHEADLAETPTAAADEDPTAEPSATPSPTPTEAASGGGVYDLVYTKWDGGQHNMYIANTNGAGEKFVFGRAAGPSWSPDGATVFFYGEEGVDRQMIEGVEYVFDGVSNGVVAINVSPIPANPSQAELFQGLDWKDGAVRWTNVSPDGQMVAFDSKRGGPDYRIYFLGTDDNRQFQFEILGEQADWSPDGQKVVYRSGRNGQTGIWISNRDDSGHTNITAGGSDAFPAWSPDGRTIVFSRDEGGNVDLYAVNTDGTNLRRLTDAPGPDTLPTFTPSGDIIFRSARTGSWGIWKMSASGGGQTEIISNAGVGPDWSFSRMDVR